LNGKKSEAVSMVFLGGRKHCKKGHVSIHLKKFKNININLKTFLIRYAYIAKENQ
jgi:hypothetical protein